MLSPITFFNKQTLKPRQQQQEVLDIVVKEWDNYDYFVLNLPTGVGKTFIACALGDAVGRTYMLTSTLQLQAQYEESWNQIVNLKGRGNYECNLNPAFTVDSAPCLANEDLKRSCQDNGTCAYYTQKEKALRAPAMITNPVYFLYSTHCGFGKDTEKNAWVKRSLLICDEAHNLEQHLISFAQSTIDPKKLHADHGAKCGDVKFTGALADDYLSLKKLRMILMARAEEYQAELEKAFPKGKTADLISWASGFDKRSAEKARKMNAKMYALDKAVQPLNIFFNTHKSEDELKRRWLISHDAQEGTLQLSPLYGDFLFEEYIRKMADKFVFMSATLGTKEQFCKELGISLDRCLFVETDTPFPPHKSPILVMPSLKLGYKDLPTSLPKIPGLIESILDEHTDQRGIIHCATYKLAEEIYRRVKPEYQKRLITRDMDILSGAASGKASQYGGRKYNNEELLRLHGTGSIKNSTLLSPSMMEGVDLVDDLSLFQIILKIPWASLADPRVKRKSELDNDWYTNNAWVHVMQASGRSTRHEEDESITYILDASFPYFYDKWKQKLPKWFKDRLVFPKG